MAIRGVIFDCDGTLLDSMPMWTEQCVALLERYGVADAQRVFSEHESLDMDKKCYWYHDNLGIGASGEALFRELWEMVAQAYDQSVRAYAGVRAFLNELRAREIPCVTLSSTPTELVRHALATHGLLSYFQELIFVGDVGRGKEFGDCYVAAARRLGVAREDVWVFEDAPFGVRSAVRAGFPTVAIVNDHDGRDESFMRAWATVVARSYEDLHVCELEGRKASVVRALVVAGSPEPSSPELVARLAAVSDVVIAADKGIDALLQAQVVPDVCCGDEDSASAEALAWARAAGATMERHPREKDDTDLGLALAVARRMAEERHAALRVTLTCASGGRPDHALGIFGVLMRLADACPRVVEDAFVCRILSPLGQDTWRLRDSVGATFSAVALLPGTRVTEKGMHWSVDALELGTLDDRGVSNWVEEADARVTCDTGMLAAFLHGAETGE